MSTHLHGKQRKYYQRSRRAAWCAAAVCAAVALLAVAAAGVEQAGAALFPSFASIAFLMWGYDYHRRLKPTAGTTD